jgi:CheY-like chemotaxis protein
MQTIGSVSGRQLLDTNNANFKLTNRPLTKLQPDLIWLHIGLPTLNGKEVARQVRQLASRTIIPFFSQETSSDVVRDARVLVREATSIKLVLRVICGPLSERFLPAGGL